MIRGDLTWFKQGWVGTHEFQSGFLLMPTNQYEGVSTALNDGFISEERRLTDPNNLEFAGHPLRANVPDERADARQPVRA